MRDEPAAPLAVDDSIVEAMQAYGAPPDAIAAAQALAEARPPAQEAFVVYADNQAAFDAFVTLRTQWQYAGMAGQRVGLDYAGVSAWLAVFVRPRRRRALMTDLLLMESAVLQADHEKREKEE